MNLSKIINAFCIGVLAVVLLFYWKSCNEIENKDSQIGMLNASVDTLKTYKNKDSLNVAEISLLNGSISDLKSIHAKQGSEIARLQKLVSKNTINATILGTTTTNHSTSATTVKHDTITKCDTACYPMYSTHYSDKWQSVVGLASKDSFRIDYKVFNDDVLESKWEKQGKWPFRKDIAIMKVVNNNPHTETTKLQSFNVEAPKPHRELWLISGVIIGAIATGFIVK